MNLPATMDGPLTKKKIDQGPTDTPYRQHKKFLENKKNIVNITKIYFFEPMNPQATQDNSISLQEK